MVLLLLVVSSSIAPMKRASAKVRRRSGEVGAQAGEILGHASCTGRIGDDATVTGEVVSGVGTTGVEAQVVVDAPVAGGSMPWERPSWPLV